MRYERENEERSEKREVGRDMEKIRKKKLRERKEGGGGIYFFYGFYHFVLHNSKLIYNKFFYNTLNTFSIHHII